MTTELKKRTEEWMQLERKTLEQRKEAEKYYDTELMKLIEEDFVKRNREKVNDKVRHLVVSVGTSYEPVVLNISLLKPENVLFLYTEKSRRSLDKVVDYCGLKATQYEKRMVNEVDPVDIYREVKDAYINWKRPERMYVDFTGGTKAMSAACALAGALVDVQMVYVASDDYLVDFRKPNPGSEKLVFIENPLTVFGDLEVEKALELFSEYDFNGAMEKLDEIKIEIPNPMTRQELNFTYLLASAYARWDALDFEKAFETMKELCFQLNRDGRNFTQHVLVQKASIIAKQKNHLSELAKITEMIHEKKQVNILKTKEIIIPLMFTMLLNAKTREAQGKYDMATLLTYRLLEMIEQRRLARYELFVSDMHYDQMKPNLKRIPEMRDLSPEDRAEWFSKEVFQIKKGLFGNRVSEGLPGQISLLEGFILLSALRDPIVYSPTVNRLTILKQLRSMVYLRNNSIFAHGLGPVERQAYEKFSRFVLTMFNQFCKIEKVDKENMERIFSWVIPVSGEE